MFLPWSLITRRSKQQDGPGASSRKVKKQNKALRRAAMKMEVLEDRVVPASQNYFVDALYDPTVGGASTGDVDHPFTNIQDALKAAAFNPGPDKVYVYGNNSNDPSKAAYVWTRDGDANSDGILDGNMMVGTDATNPVEMYFRAALRNPGSPAGDGSGGAAARLIVKMLNNVVDVLDNSTLRIEGSNDAARVIFTSIYDDTAGGDTNGDGTINSPQRANWGGIRYRADAIDQGATTATGSLVNFADIRYTGQTLFDEVSGFPSEFASIRMEANATNPANVRSAQVRVWNTVFQHGGRALDVNVNALGDGGKATSVITGPDLGAATTQGLRFVDNTINGAFVFVPTDPFTGFLQQMVVNSTLDDVGVPYVITNRLVLANSLTTTGAPGLPAGVTLTFNEGTIFKAQNTGLDGIDFGQPNDRTYGTIKVNGSINRPVLFTALTDDTVPANTDLATLYNNGSLDTNNDGNATTPQPGDWGGIRIAQGNIDHAVVKFGGGLVQVSGTFVNWPAIRVFARDLTPAGGVVQQVRVSNTEVTQTYTVNNPGDPSNNVDSPAIDLFSRDDGDTRYAGPFSPIVRTGDVQIMDNWVHDNQGKAIQAHPLYYQDARNSLGGYGVFFRRNVIEQNASNGVFTKFILDQGRAIDQNLPSAGGVMDDTDIVHVIEGQALIVHPDQYFAMMSRRGVVPDAASGGYLQRIAGVNTATAPTAAEAAFNSFLANLVLRLPGNLPTDVTQPLNLPLQRGPFGVNNGLVDSGLFYYQSFFDTSARGAANSNGTRQRGEEWRDWGVNFVYTGQAGNINDPLRPFVTVSDPSTPGGLMLKTDTLDGNGSFDIVFPNAVSAFGFYIVNNQQTSPNERIEMYGTDGKLVEVASLPQTLPGGKAFFSRISKTPIYKVRIVEDAGDSPASLTTFGGAANVAIPDTGTNAEASVNVPSSFTISDVNVNVSIAHGRASDLVLELVAPDGTVVPLASRTGGAGTAGANYTNTYFDDAATTPISAGLASFTGAFSPVSFDPFSATPTGLGVLNGKNAQGTWKLRVRDMQAGTTGSITNFQITFKGQGLQADNPGITGLTWVDAPESLVVKANTDYTTITASGVRNGYAGITQDANGVITNGFVPQMFNLANGGGSTGAVTFGQSSNSSFTYGGPPVTLLDGGLNIIPLNIGSDMIPYDMTVRVNLTYGGSNNTLRMRLRAPDGSEIDLITPNTGVLGNGMVNTTFDDQSELSNNNATFLANLNNQSVQSSSFSATRALAANVNPFGLSFYRKNVRGTWSLVIEKQAGVAGTLNNFTITFRNPVQGWGSTLRILGQGTNPVVLTGIQDDTVGAGPVGHVQVDNGSDGPTTADPGQWQGIQILPGVNSAASDVVTQNPNGTLNRRYADLNPYTRWDEGLTYPGLSNPNGALLSTRDEVNTGAAALNGVAANVPWNAKNTMNLQDGTLVEYADVRFAQTGIQQRGYPRNKLTIDGVEWEPSSTPNEVNPTAATTLIQPVPVISQNEAQQFRFETTDGTYRVAGRMGGTGESQFTQDVDWFQLPNPAQPVSIYIDVERARQLAGGDEPNGRQISIAVYDAAYHLIYWSGSSGLDYLTVPGDAFNSGNNGGSRQTLGPVSLQPGNVDFINSGGVRDATYIALMPYDPVRIPRSFVDSGRVGWDGQGVAPPGRFYTFGEFTASPRGADGGTVTMTDQNGNLVNPTNDYPVTPPNYPGAPVVGGYEMELRMVGAERQDNPPKINDGQILIRSNTIQSSAGDGIALSDARVAASNTNLGANLPLQAARFSFNATNLAVNSTGNAYRNEDVNNVNPSFSAPANFVPGPTIQNNLIVRNQGVGISLIENRNTNNTTAGANGTGGTFQVQANPVPYSSNLITPTAFTQIFNNTIDANGGGISLSTRGGPTVENNIVSNNGSGLTIQDGYDILTNTPAVVPVVSYNIFFNNAINGAFTGSNNLVGSGAAVDPQYINPSQLDYRVKVSSPAVDSAVSELQDRLRSVRFPQVPTRAPNLDLRGKPRIDQPSRPNVGTGAFPFYDRGALETSELSLRVIGLSILADNNVLGSQVGEITVDFAGRVDTSTVNANTVQLHQGSATGPVIPINFAISPNVYDTHTNVHTFTFKLFQPLTDGTYVLTLNGSATTTSVMDIAGQLLDGEFPAPYRLPSGDGAPGGTFQYPFTIRTGKVSGTVWQNSNGNATIDPGEPGLGNVSVQLVGAGADDILFTGDDAVVATTVTDPSGGYLFQNVGSGQFYVQVINATLPAPNYRLNTPPAQKVVNLPIGGVRANVNFGYWTDNLTGVVNGRVFNDINGNGVVDPGEGPLTDPSNPSATLPLTITLTSGGADFDLSTPGDNAVLTVLTDSNGNYSFTGLAGNSYRLDVDQSPIPGTFVRTSPATVPVTFFLFPDTSKTQNYGFQEKQATVTGLVFNDANGNGTQDGGEGGIGSVTVRLLGAGIDGQFGTADDLATLVATTAADGSYSFFPLTAGKYRVAVDSSSPVLANFFLTTGNATQDLTLTNGHDTFPAAGVGYRQDPFAGQILGLVFNDLNANKQYDPGEPGFGGVNVQLRWAGRDGILGNSDDGVFTATTDGSGAYNATGLPVGDFYVQPLNPPVGYALTTPASVPVKITLGLGGINATSGFFGYQAANASISGVVFSDTNGNGAVDGAETGRFAGVRVFIDANSNGAYDAGETFAVSAAGTGAYSLASLPAGTYRVMIDTATLPPSVPAGFVPSTGVRVINLGAGANVIGQDLGLQQRNGQVVGRVFIDSNSNGSFDAGSEVGSPGQTVTLTFTGSPLPTNFQNPQTVVTASDGTFTFAGLPAGNYTVQTTTPSGGTVPTNPGNPQSFTLPAGASTSRLFPVQFAQSATAGVWYLSFTSTPSTTLFNSDGSATVVNDRDIVRLTAPQDGEWHYDVFFHGDSFGLTGGAKAIDAFTFTNTGDVIVSTRGAFSVQTNYSNGTGSGAVISGFGEDLLRFHPTTQNLGGGLTTGTWSLFFKGSRVGLSGSAENIDAVSLFYSGTTLSRILLSTTGSALAGSISAGPQDILSFAPTSLGTTTAGKFSKLFTGSTKGLNDPAQENIDALFYQTNPASSAKPFLYISTAGSFAVPGFSGNNGDILKFSSTSGGPVGALAGSFTGIALSGSQFGHAGANVTGFYMGTIATDPNPFGGGFGGFGGASFASGGNSQMASYVAGLQAPAGLSVTAPTTTSGGAKSLLSTTAAKVAAAAHSTVKSGVTSADKVFATSKRARSSVNGLVSSLLQSLTSLKS